MYDWSKHEPELLPYYTFLGLAALAYDAEATRAEAPLYAPIVNNVRRCPMPKWQKFATDHAQALSDILEHLPYGAEIPDFARINDEGTDSGLKPTMQEDWNPNVKGYTPPDEDDCSVPMDGSRYPLIDVANEQMFIRWLDTQTKFARVYDQYTPNGLKTGVAPIRARNFMARRAMLLRRIYYVHVIPHNSVPERLPLLVEFAQRHLKLAFRSVAAFQKTLHVHALMELFQFPPLFPDLTRGALAQAYLMSFYPPPPGVDGALVDAINAIAPKPLEVDADLIEKRIKRLIAQVRADPGALYQSESEFWVRLRKAHHQELWLGDYWYLVYGYIRAHFAKKFEGADADAWAAAVDANLLARERYFK